MAELLGSAGVAAGAAHGGRREAPRRRGAAPAGAAGAGQETVAGRRGEATTAGSRAGLWS